MIAESSENILLWYSRSNQLYMQPIVAQRLNEPWTFSTMLAHQARNRLNLLAWQENHLPQTIRHGFHRALYACLWCHNHHHEFVCCSSTKAAFVGICNGPGLNNVLVNAEVLSSISILNHVAVCPVQKSKSLHSGWEGPTSRPWTARPDASQIPDMRLVANLGQRRNWRYMMWHNYIFQFRPILDHLLHHNYILDPSSMNFSQWSLILSSLDVSTFSLW